jgi:hypothetical protein
MTRSTAVLFCVKPALVSNRWVRLSESDRTDDTLDDFVHQVTAFERQAQEPLAWVVRFNFMLINSSPGSPYSINFGTNPTASATTSRMAENRIECRGVPVNQAYKVAVITNT